MTNPKTGKFHVTFSGTLAALVAGLPSPKSAGFAAAQKAAYENTFVPVLDLIVGTSKVPGVELKAKDWPGVIEQVQVTAKALGVNDNGAIKRRIKVLKDRATTQAELESKKEGQVSVSMLTLEQTDAVQAAFDTALNGVPSLVGHEAVERIVFAADFTAKLVPSVELGVALAMYHKLGETAKMARINASQTVIDVLAKIDQVIKGRTNGGGHGPQAHQPGAGVTAQAQQQQ